MTRFYAHESCGKCTPCREGTWWAERVLDRIANGYGVEGDLPVVEDLGKNIMFRAFCALADGAAAVLQSSLKHFREEFEEHVRLGGCPLRVAHEEVAV
jgi:NADH-quinone oxidoreductase subunit F